MDWKTTKTSGYLQTSTRPNYRKMRLRAYLHIVFHRITNTVFPDQIPKSRVYKDYRLRLVYELMQPLLDHYNSRTSGRTKEPSSGADRLKGKHFTSSKHPICRCSAVCAHVRRANGTQWRKKTSSYCSKCEKFICKKCFEKYHTKRNAK